jgi:hypothetical protein
MNMISASPTRSSRLRVSALLVAAASAFALLALPAADASARDFTYRPAQVLSFQWLAGQPQWQQPSLSRLARSAWVLDDRANFAMFQPDGYPAVRGSYTLRRSLATFHGTWSFSTGYSGLSTVEVAGTIDFSRRQPVLRIAYSAGQTLAAVLNCNDLSCTRYGSSTSKAFRATARLRRG